MTRKGIIKLVLGLLLLVIIIITIIVVITLYLIKNVGNENNDESDNNKNPIDINYYYEAAVGVLYYPYLSKLVFTDEANQFKLSSKFSTILSSIGLSESDVMYVYYDTTNGFERETNWDELFKDNVYIKEIYFGNLDASNVVSMGYAFSGCEYLETVSFNSTFNPYSVYYMFDGCKSLTKIDIADESFSNTTEMTDMFANCSSLEVIEFPEGFGKSATYMTRMFYKCKSLTSVSFYPAEEMYISSLISISEMFCGCEKLKELDIRSIKPNDNLLISDVFEEINTDQWKMRINCSLLTYMINHDNAPITTYKDSEIICKNNTDDCETHCESNVIMYYLDLGAVLEYGEGYTLYDSEILVYEYTATIDLLQTPIQDLLKTENYKSVEAIDYTNIVESAMSTLEDLYAGCELLASIDFGENFNTSNVSSMSGMFAGCSSLEELDLSGFDTSNVSSMENMFNGCESLTMLDATGFTTANVESEGMFEGISSSWKTYMTWAFIKKLLETGTLTFSDNISNDYADDIALTLECSNTEISNYSQEITSYGVGYKLFTDALTFNCYATLDTLTKPIYDLLENYEDITTINYSSIDSNVLMTNETFSLYGLFRGCTSLSSITFGDNFDTSNVSNMSYLFSGCTSLSKIDLSTFKTDSLEDMSYMFNNCANLSSITFGNNFTANYVYNMSHLFSGCTSLESITNLSTFKTDSLKNTSYMFNNCTTLSSIDLSTFETDSLEDMSYMFSGCTNLQEVYMDNFENTAGINMEGMFENVYNINHDVVIDTSFKMDDETQPPSVVNMFNNFGSGITAMVYMDGSFISYLIGKGELINDTNNTFAEGTLYCVYTYLDEYGYAHIYTSGVIDNFFFFENVVGSRTEHYILQ